MDTPTWLLLWIMICLNQPRTADRPFSSTYRFLLIVCSILLIFDAVVADSFSQNRRTGNLLNCRQSPGWLTVWNGLIRFGRLNRMNLIPDCRSVPPLFPCLFGWLCNDVWFHQTILNETSALLYRATKERSHLRSIDVLLPASWTANIQGIDVDIVTK